MKLLSVIIPSYNMKDYIEECLNSLVVSDGLENLEVLVINDGSTDNTAELARSFEERWPDTFRVISKENGHYGSCVNRGLKEATGKYVKVLDADDSFNTKVFEEYLKKLAEIDVDVVISGLAYVVDGVRRDKKIKLPANKRFSLYDVYLRDAMSMLSMHSLAHRRELLADLCYSQSEGINYTDNEWVFAQLSQARSFYYMPGIIYLYRFGREGQSISPEVRKKKFADEIQMTYALFDIFKSVVVKGDRRLNIMLEKRLYLLMKGMYRAHFLVFENYHCPEFSSMDKRLKEVCPTVYYLLAKMPASTPLLFFPFVGIWRRNPDSRLLRWVASAYRRKKKIV